MSYFFSFPQKGVIFQRFRYMSIWPKLLWAGMVLSLDVWWEILDSLSEGCRLGSRTYICGRRKWTYWLKSEGDWNSCVGKLISSVVRSAFPVELFKNSLKSSWQSFLFGCFGPHSWKAILFPLMMRTDTSLLENKLVFDSGLHFTCPYPGSKRQRRGQHQKSQMGIVPHFLD